MIKVSKAIPLQQKPSLDEREQMLQKASQAYEKHFLREMVKAMRSTVQHSGMTEPTMAENIYREQLDSEYVDAWADRGGIGLADIIYSQLQEQFVSRGPKLIPPQGPVPINEKTQIKIDKTDQHFQGIPVVEPNEARKTDMSWLIYPGSSAAEREVQSPWNAEVKQLFRTEDGRNTVRLKHDNGLESTIRFVGTLHDLRPGTELAAGQRLGQLTAGERSINWQVTKIVAT